MPKARRNVRPRWLWSAKPVSAATAAGTQQPSRRIEPEQSAERLRRQAIAAAERARVGFAAAAGAFGGRGHGAVQGRRHRFGRQCRGETVVADELEKRRLVQVTLPTPQARHGGDEVRQGDGPGREVGVAAEDPVGLVQGGVRHPRRQGDALARSESHPAVREAEPPASRQHEGDLILVVEVGRQRDGPSVHVAPLDDLRLGRAPVAPGARWRHIVFPRRSKRAATIRDNVGAGSSGIVRLLFRPRSHGFRTRLARPKTRTPGCRIRASHGPRRQFGESPPPPPGPARSASRRAGPCRTTG